MDSVIKEVVEFVADHCLIILWGLKTVPIGNGKMTVILNLIHMCTAESMWKEYLAKKESEKAPFWCIIRIMGPLCSNHGAYRGSAYNLLLKWEDWPPTWEPLYAVSLDDDPIICVLFGYKNKLLDKSGWKRFKW
jgi:hypothetical protein